MNPIVKKIKHGLGFEFSKVELLFLLKSLIMFSIWLVVNDWAFIDRIIMYSMKLQSIFILNTIGGQEFDASGIYTTKIDSRFYLVCPSVLFKISKGCAGKSILFLYASFILIFPQNNIKRKFLFLIIGLLIIHEYNVIRIISLSLTIKFNKEWYDFLHIYLFQILIYFILFLLIQQYLNLSKKNEIQKI